MNKTLDLLGVIRAIRKGMRVDKVKFSDWETEYNKIKDTKEQGYAIEWLCNAYLMFIQHEGECWTVLEDNGDEIFSASNINLGKRGGVGYGGHSPDIIARNGDKWLIGSCKRNKTSWQGMDGDKLKAWVINNVSSKNNIQYLAVTNKSNITHNSSWGEFETIWGGEDFTKMWDKLCSELKKEKWSLLNLEKRSMKPLYPRDAVQEYLLDQVMNSLTKLGCESWLHAVMRTGKSYIFAMAAAKTNSKKIVLISHFPTDTFRQWKNIFASALQFQDYDLFMSDVSDLKQIKNSKKYVLICSAQKIKSNDEWFKFMSNEKFDMFGYDEVHYGYESERTQAILDGTNSKSWLYMSGTMDVLKANNRIDPLLITEWTYLDVQLCKNGKNEKLNKYENRNKNIYSDFTEAVYPTMNLAHICPDRVLRNKLTELGNSEYEQTWEKIYKKPAILKEWVRILLGGGLILSKKEKEMYMGNLRTPVDVAQKHKFMLWFCPNTDAQRTLKNVIQEFIEENPLALIAKRKIHIFNGDNEDGKFSREIPKLMRDDDQHLLILCGQGTTGITFEDTPVCIIGRDIGSITTYQQTIFRVMSSSNVAFERWVYDLSFGHIFVENVKGLVDSNRCQEKDFEQRKELFGYINITEGFGTWNYNDFEEKRREAFKGCANRLMNFVNEFSAAEFFKVPEDIDPDVKTRAELAYGDDKTQGRTEENKKNNKNKGDSEDELTKEEKDEFERDKAIQRFLLKEAIKAGICIKGN